LEHCVDELKLAYKAVTDGKFQLAMEHFANILYTLPLLVVEKKAQEQEVYELLNICREYYTALRLEITRRETTSDQMRQAALSAYFTRCKIQTVHLVLGLRMAIKCSYQINNFKTTAGFCRRLIELVSAPANSQSNLSKIVDMKQIKQVLKVCEKKNTDAKPIDFDESKQFDLCCSTLTPIYSGKPLTRCPYCHSVYQSEFDGQLCKTCNLSKIGAVGTGLRLFPN